MKLFRWSNLVQYFMGILSLAAVAAAAPELEPATLRVQGQPLFTFRARIGSVQPVDRVRLISERIAQVSSDRFFDLDKIEARDSGEGNWEVLAGEKILLVITPEDARLAKLSANVIAEGIAITLKQTLHEARRLKSPREIAIHALYALASLLGLVLVLWGLNFVHRRAQAELCNSQGTRLRPVKIGTYEILPIDRMVLLFSGVLRITRLILTIIILYFFIPLVLSFFPLTAQLSPVLLGYILDPLRQVFRGFIAFVPNLFFIALNIVITRFFLRFIRFFFEEIRRGNLRFAGFYSEWAYPTYQLVRALAIAFTAITIFPYIPGSSSPAFQGVSVFIGVLVSLGSTSAVANVVAGIVLTYMRSFRPGDRVKIADTTGDIVEKTLLVTRVRTQKNVDITIPNSMVLSSHIVNYSSLAQTEGLILHTELTLGYDVPWRKVHELLIQAASNTKGILESPKPFVYQSSLEDSYVRYQINAYTHSAHGMEETYSHLHQNIQDAFNEAGVEILSPSYQALRDGNTVTIPAAHRPADYEAPSFRIEQKNASANKPGPGLA